MSYENKVRTLPDMFSDPEDKRKIQNQFLIIESYRDFIGWLFETHIDWMSEGEAWEEFNKYNELQNSKP